MDEVSFMSKPKHPDLDSWVSDNIKLMWTFDTKLRQKHKERCGVWLESGYFLSHIYFEINNLLHSYKPDKGVKLSWWVSYCTATSLYLKFMSKEQDINVSWRKKSNKISLDAVEGEVVLSEIAQQEWENYQGKFWEESSFRDFECCEDFWEIIFKSCEPEHRKSLEARYREGLRISQIAKLVGKSDANIKMLIRRGLKLLRLELVGKKSEDK